MGKADTIFNSPGGANSDGATVKILDLIVGNGIVVRIAYPNSRTDASRLDSTSPGDEVVLDQIVLGDVGVGVGLGAAAQYRAPVLKRVPDACPPQMIISLPVHTAV